MRKHHTAVPNHELWILTLAYVRYALGRMSTAPSTAADFVRSYWPAFDRDQQAQIAREIRDEVDSSARTGRLIGHQCDHDVWVRLLAWCEERLGGEP